LPFWPLKEYLILIQIKFQINRYTTIHILEPKTSDWVLRVFLLSSPFKAYSFFIYMKFPIKGYITWPYWFWQLTPCMCPECLFSPFWPPKLYFFLLRIIFPIDRLYRFQSTNFVFGLWGLIFTFMTRKSVYFLHLY
jgi:hypothetical protein